jgi:hypothetical protein
VYLEGFLGPSPPQHDGMIFIPHALERGSKSQMKTGLTACMQVGLLQGICIQVKTTHDSNTILINFIIPHALET